MSRRICLLAAALALAAACRRETPAAPAPVHETLPAAPVAATDGASLYDLRLTLTDQAGRALPLDAFRGGPVIISMFYGTCPNACPLLIADIKRIEKALPDEAKARLHVLLVSFDPERDSVARLAELVAMHRVDGERWRMARLSEDKVRELAAVLGIKYRNAADGSFNHSSVITLLDGEGAIAQRVEGLDQPAGDLVARVTALAKTPAAKEAR